MTDTTTTTPAREQQPDFRVEDRTSKGQGHSVIDHAAHYSACGIAHYVCPKYSRLFAASPKLLAALLALSGMEVKGHAILSRLQFSEEGRKLAALVTEAIAEATGKGAA